jgi:hypothetical protein
MLNAELRYMSFKSSSTIQNSIFNIYCTVRRSDEEIEATQQMGYFQRNQGWLGRRQPGFSLGSVTRGCYLSILVIKNGPKLSSIRTNIGKYVCIKIIAYTTFSNLN